MYLGRDEVPGSKKLKDLLYASFLCMKYSYEQARDAVDTLIWHNILVPYDGIDQWLHFSEKVDQCVRVKNPNITSRMNRDVLSFYTFGEGDETNEHIDEVNNNQLVLIDSEGNIDIQVAKMTGWFSKAYFPNYQEADFDQHARVFNCRPNLNKYGKTMRAMLGNIDDNRADPLEITSFRVKNETYENSQNPEEIVDQDVKDIQLALSVLDLVLTKLQELQPNRPRTLYKSFPFTMMPYDGECHKGWQSCMDSLKSLKGKTQPQVIFTHISASQVYQTITDSLNTYYACIGDGSKLESSFIFNGGQVDID